MVKVGLLRRDVSGAGWELTPNACELLKAALAHPHKSTLVAELLDLGVIQAAPPGSGLGWAFTPHGRKVMGRLLTHPLPTEKCDPNRAPVE